MVDGGNSVEEFDLGGGGVEYRVVEIRCRADDCEGNVRV